MCFSFTTLTCRKCHFQCIETPRLICLVSFFFFIISSILVNRITAPFENDNTPTTHIIIHYDARKGKWIIRDTGEEIKSASFFSQCSMKVLRHTQTTYKIVLSSICLVIAVIYIRNFINNLIQCYYFFLLWVSIFINAWKIVRLSSLFGWN